MIDDDEYINDSEEEEIDSEEEEIDSSAMRARQAQMNSEGEEEFLNDSHSFAARHAQMNAEESRSGRYEDPWWDDLNQRWCNSTGYYDKYEQYHYY